MKKIIGGLIIGAVLGVINVAPLLFQELEISVVLSNYIIWLVAGFVLSIAELKMKHVMQGVLIALIVSASSLVYIAASGAAALVWTLLWTVLSGGLMGVSYEKLVVKKGRVACK